jgi:hypothetical protein
MYQFDSLKAELKKQRHHSEGNWSFDPDVDAKIIGTMFRGIAARLSIFDILKFIWAHSLSLF